MMQSSLHSRQKIETMSIAKRKVSELKPEDVVADCVARLDELQQMAKQTFEKGEKLKELAQRPSVVPFDDSVARLIAEFVVPIENCDGDMSDIFSDAVWDNYNETYEDETPFASWFVGWTNNLLFGETRTPALWDHDNVLDVFVALLRHFRLTQELRNAIEAIGAKKVDYRKSHSVWSKNWRDIMTLLGKDAFIAANPPPSC